MRKCGCCCAFPKFPDIGCSKRFSKAHLAPIKFANWGQRNQGALTSAASVILRDGMRRWTGVCSFAHLVAALSKCLTHVLIQRPCWLGNGWSCNVLWEIRSTSIMPICNLLLNGTIEWVGQRALSDFTLASKSHRSMQIHFHQRTATKSILTPHRNQGLLACRSSQLIPAFPWEHCTFLECDQDCCSISMSLPLLGSRLDAERLRRSSWLYSEE
jgi:hypothetical protein